MMVFQLYQGRTLNSTDPLWSRLYVLLVCMNAFMLHYLKIYSMHDKGGFHGHGKDFYRGKVLWIWSWILFMDSINCSIHSKRKNIRKFTGDVMPAESSQPNVVSCCAYTQLTSVWLYAQESWRPGHINPGRLLLISYF